MPRSMQFTRVQETMLFPLYGRALYSQNPDNDFKDEQAEDIFGKLGVDLDEIRKYVDETAQVGCVSRAHTIDLLLTKYLEIHPSATVVNIGAGLDTTFVRIDNGTVYFYNLDLPDAIEFRKKFISDSARNLFISKSVFDHEWIDMIRYEPREGIFMFAAGVFPYFTSTEIKELLQAFAARFPGGELLFDAVSKRGMSLINKKIRRARKKGETIDVEITWHVNKATDLCQFSEKIQVVDEFGLYAKIPRASKWKLKTKANKFFNTKLKLSKFIHLRFKEE